MPHGPNVGLHHNGKPPVLSILMPAHNEASTIETVVRRVLDAEVPCSFELIVVDDGSLDETRATLDHVSDARLRVLRHPVNRGKGAAIRTAVDAARGEYVLIFDADLEYSPDDIARVVAPVLDSRAIAVYGTRLFGNNTVYQSYRYAVGNKVLTAAANLLFDSAISDLHTCLKLYSREIFTVLNCNEDGFGLDTQLTARALRAGIRPFEVPISYHSRSREYGKKISWLHGVECLRILARERWSRRVPWLEPTRELARESFRAMYVHSSDSGRVARLLSLPLQAEG